MARHEHSRLLNWWWLPNIFNGAASFGRRDQTHAHETRIRSIQATAPAILVQAAMEIEQCGLRYWHPKGFAGMGIAVRIRYCLLAIGWSMFLFLQGCASLVEQTKAESYWIRPTNDQELARLVPTTIQSEGGSAFRPLPFSGYSMDARLTLAEHAQRTLDLQYYLIQNDSTGRLLLRSVRDAAVRGVRVRILVDDLYTAHSDTLLKGIAAYPNVEVRLFNPFPAGRALDITRWGLSLLDLARLNHRMHNKLFIADGAIAVAGGRNIADEYFFRSGRGNFIDFDLLVMGDAVPQLCQVFDLFWNSRRVFTLDSLESISDGQQARRDEFERLTAANHRPVPRARTGERDILGYAPLSVDILKPPLKLLYGHVQVIADDPEKVSGRAESGKDPSTVTSMVQTVVNRANTDVLLVSPYFVPDGLTLDCVVNVRAKGVPVTLVTNTMAANDEPLVSAAYARYRKQLLVQGVSIYELSPGILRMDRMFDDMFGDMLGTGTGRLHAKMLVLDHHTTFVGSMNLDFRSSRENTELGLLVDSRELADDVAALAAQIRTSGTYRLHLDHDRDVVQWIDPSGAPQTVFESEPEIDFFTRVEVFMLSPFIGDSLL